MYAVRINVALLLIDFTYPFFDVDLACFKTCCLFLRPGGRGREGVFREKLGGVCGPLSTTLTLFMPKICDFHYPIYDPTIN